MDSDVDGSAGVQPEEAELLERLQEDLRRMTVSDYLLYVMQSLSALAFRKMGVTAETRGERDLQQVRLAIDAFKSLVEAMSQVQDAQEMNAHRSALAQLQLAYVGALKAGGDET